MSRRERMAVVCGCGRAFETDVWIALNVTTDPELRQLLLSGDLNKVQCPVCGRESRVDHELLYVDMARHLLIAMLPRAHGASWMGAKRDFERRSRAQKELWSRAAGLTAEEVQAGLYVRRLVYGFNELREKVFLFDKGLDDRAAELLKLGLAWREREARAAPTSDGVEIEPVDELLEPLELPLESLELRTLGSPAAPVTAGTEPFGVAATPELAPRSHPRSVTPRVTPVPVVSRPLAEPPAPPPLPTAILLSTQLDQGLTAGMDARASEHILGGQPEILESVRKGGEVLLEGVEARELHFAVLPINGVPLRLSVGRDAYEAVLDGVMSRDPFGNLGRWPYVSVRALLAPPEPEREAAAGSEAALEPGEAVAPARVASAEPPAGPPVVVAETPAAKPRRPWWRFWR